MPTLGEKARYLVHEALGEKRVLDEIAAMDRYLAVTAEAVYVGSVGPAADAVSRTGRKLRKYPLETISSVECKDERSHVRMEIVCEASRAIGDDSYVSRSIATERIMSFWNVQRERAHGIAALIMEQKARLRTATEGRPCEDV